MFLKIEIWHLQYMYNITYNTLAFKSPLKRSLQIRTNLVHLRTPIFNGRSRGVQKKLKELLLSLQWQRNEGVWYQRSSESPNFSGSWKICESEGKDLIIFTYPVWVGCISKLCGSPLATLSGLFQSAIEVVVAERFHDLATTSFDQSMCPEKKK